VEVLSPTTEAFDRGDKFADYLLCQQRMNVDCYRRDVAGRWVFSPTVRGTVWSWLVSFFSVQSLLCMRMFLDWVKSSVQLWQSQEKAV